MRKVAIIGKAGTVGLAPWRDETWEIWGMPWISCPRVDRFFDMHSQQMCDESVLFPEAKEWIAKTQEQFPDVPVYCDPTRAHAYKNPIEYPLNSVLKFLPIPFLENSIAYMLALAILEDVREIALYGVHLMASGEYAFERPSVTYLVGLAQGRGILVTIAPGSPLFISDFNAGRYGQAGGRRF